MIKKSGKPRITPASERSSFSRPGARPGFRPTPSRRPRREDDEDENLEQRERAAPQEAVLAAPKKENVLLATRQMWSTLFSSPVHLDSALSKQPKNLKSILARVIPTVLLKPVSLAEALGVGVPAGEPWTLSPAKLVHWRPVELMASRIYETMANRPAETMSTRDDFPPAMVAEWETTWGAETVEKLVETLSQEPPLSLRAARKVGPATLLRNLKEEGRIPVKAELSRIAPLGVRLAGYTPVLQTPWYKEGAFEIQDEGSQLMALFALWPELYCKVLTEKPGQTAALKTPPELPALTPPWNVIDACAGAGGKSLALADAMAGKGRIYSYDTSEKKLQSLRRRATHAGYNNIQAIALENGKEAEKIGKFKRRADVVLVDAPCSGWGVLRRNPDIKWRQTVDVLERMPQIQSRLLDQYSTLVSPKGRLIYGVCTFRKSETLGVVEDFLSTHPEFEAGEGGFLGPGSSDGFFMQAFYRRK